MVSNTVEVVAALVSKGVPENQAPWYTLAEAQAKLGVSNASLSALRVALEQAGFDTTEAMSKVITFAGFAEAGQLQ